MIQKIAPALGLLSAMVIAPEALTDDTLSLNEAIEIARNAYDPSVKAILERARSEEEDSLSARTLPDPNISLGFANVPVDDFNLTREPFTQIQVSARQAFPRGNTRALNAPKAAPFGLGAIVHRRRRRTIPFSGIHQSHGSTHIIHILRLRNCAH